LPTIKQFFSNKKSVEEIVALLRAENSVWSNNVLGAIEQASPTAIKVTFRAMQEIVNNNLPLDAAYNLAFRAAVHMMVRKQEMTCSILTNNFFFKLFCRLTLTLRKV